MSASSIPERVDVVLLGTGLVNSILAAACSRIGKSVLHLDENGYYGNDWASFTFQQLVDWIRSREPQDESLLAIPEELLSKSRMFCLDLAPRYLFSNGPMVDLLVKSNVARYHEFKNNIRILCSIDGSMGRDDEDYEDEQIHVMPCRRNEVFTSPLLPNLADKRRLMKFIEACLSLEDSRDGGPGGQSAATNQDGELLASSDKPIGQYLQERGLSSTLQEFIINSIAMVEPEAATREACKRIKRFMVATERYGRSPFLFPLYGCGEFPQSFCRLSAVFGGLYCLNTQIKSVKLTGSDPVDAAGEPSSHHFTVVFSDDEHTVKSDMLVVEPSSIESCLDLLPATCNKQLQQQQHKEYLSRAILITRKSIVPPPPEGDADQRQDLISFMRVPPGRKNSHVIFLIELNSTALVCPKDYCVLYLWTRASANSAREDLSATVRRLFKNDHTRAVAWSFYYRQLTATTPRNSAEAAPESGQSPAGLHVTGPSCDDLDYAGAVGEAERLFARMCPGEEFLPRAPDPDEIVSV